MVSLAVERLFEQGVTVSANAVMASMTCVDTDEQDPGQSSSVPSAPFTVKAEAAPSAEAGPSGLSLKELEGRICSFAGRLAMQMHDWLRLLAEFDERKGWSGCGIVSCSHWLSWACAVSPGVAREYLRVARTLPELPLIDAAFASGRLSYSKVRAVTRLAGQVDEGVLLTQALIQTAPQLERTIKAYRGKVGSGFTAQQRRRASWSVDADGMWVLTARLPAEEGALVAAALAAATNFDDSAEPDCAALEGESVAPTEHPADKPEADGVVRRKDVDAEVAKILGVDQEHLTAADALVEVARRALAAGPDDSSGEDRHLVVVHVDAEVLDAAPASTSCAEASMDSSPTDSSARGSSASDSSSGSGPLGGGRCHLQRGPGLDPVTAMRLSCDAPVVGAVHAFVGDGIDLCLGRQTRKISAALRRALGIRDGGCRWPGCHRVTHLQAHHVQHWANGGPTDPINLVLLCRTHHMLMHEGGFSIAWALGRPGTSWVVTDPTGCPVPEVWLFNPGPSTSFADRTIVDPGPDAIRSGWAGERFRVAETCGVLLDYTLPRSATTSNTNDGEPGPARRAADPTSDDPVRTKCHPGDTGADSCRSVAGSAHRSAADWATPSTARGSAIHAPSTTGTTMPNEERGPVAMSEQGDNPAPPPRDEWFESIDLTKVSDEELIDGTYWRKLMDELAEAELAEAELSQVSFLAESSLAGSAAVTTV